MVRGAQSTPTVPPREIIMGIDPGSLRTGWGVVERCGGQAIHVAHGTIAVAKELPQALRLQRIYQGLCAVMARHRPDRLSLEKVFFSRNVQSSLKLGQARGIALLAAAEHQVAVAEYAATEIKLATVGLGHASKAQVQRMVGVLLGVPEIIQADAADALAAALCYAQGQRLPAEIQRLQGTGRRATSWRNAFEFLPKS